MTASGPAPTPLLVATREQLAEALGIRLRTLNFWLYATSIDERYKSFELKRSGDRPPRIIEAPIKPIKDVQRRLLPLVSGYFRAHPAVHGYVDGRSIVTNARVHWMGQSRL